MLRSQGRRGTRALGLLAFVAVYREAFETILFLQTLWLQLGPVARLGALAGGATAVAALAAAGWSMLKLSLRLPIGVFFSVSAALMYVLAVVFAGKGIMAIQEAGYLPLSAVPVPRISWLGIYPSLQSLLLQAMLVLALVYLAWIRPRTHSLRTNPEL
jgi:high-affinity iron transporter